MPITNTFGTLTSWDTLLVQQQTIQQFGEDNAWDGVASYLNSYNAQVDEMLGDFVETSTDRYRRYGGVIDIIFQKMDEMGTPNAQKGKVGAPMGFPLEMYSAALQWNRLYMQVKKVSDLTGQINGMLAGDQRNILKNIKIALFMGINYNFIDYLVDHVSDNYPLPVKALINGDGAVIPPGPNGEIFDPTTHNHYLATTTLTNPVAQGFLETVLEHYNEGEAVIFIHRSNEGDWRALPDFKGLTYASTIRADTQEYGAGTLDKLKIYNRLIGYFRGAEVWVKPWMIANYAFCWMRGVGKPLVRRIRGIDPNGGAPAPQAGELTLLFEDEIHPLRAKAWAREFGFGVWNRTNGAMLYTGGTIYTQPVIVR